MLRVDGKRRCFYGAFGRKNRQDKERSLREKAGVGISKDLI